jgi:4-amino-4-deoxy-L-arabinose transferase-like glycosyltransferase/glycosyltransferase involved in cell wall biosynthesis/putative flippase GtrA
VSTDVGPGTLTSQEKRERQEAGLALLLSIARSTTLDHPLPPIRRGAPVHSRPHYPDTPALAAPDWDGPRHRQPPNSAVGAVGDVAHRHWIRFAVFGAIGGLVFVAGLALQILLVHVLHVGAVLAYIAQGVFSVQLSFLLNRYVTWRERSLPFLVSWRRFNAQKIVMSVVNAVAYAGLIRLGMEYIAANIVLTAFFTPVNYVIGHRWSFTSRKRMVQAARVIQETLPPFRSPFAGPMPTVSIVVPCKDNARTIRKTVESLLRQDYPALEEVILVGSVGDSTWKALKGIRDRRLVIMEQPPTPGKRDPNVKRARGVQEARGELLALADSDIVMRRSWLSQAVGMLQVQGGGCVAGGMESINDTFWGRFVDGNVLSAKTPRVEVPYLVTRDNFGRRGTKPPTTANVVLTRDVYEDCPLDPDWAYGYEDYEWFWRIAKNRHHILFSNLLNGRHHHRQGIRSLSREYRRAGEGCARFTLAHRDSPLARKRFLQAILVPVVSIAAIGAIAAAASAGYTSALLFVAGSCMLAVTGREIAHSRRLESATYPFISFILAGMFAWALTTTVLKIVVGLESRPCAMGASVTIIRPIVPPARPVQRKRAWLSVSLVSLALALGALVRLWQLGGKPGWQSDETVYVSIGSNVATHGTLNEHLQYGAAWTPFLYHPPFYFVLLGNWFKLFGAGVLQARTLAVLMSLVAFAVLFRLLWKIHGPQVALMATAVMIFDGWLLFSQRVSYIENTLMVLVVAAVLTYQRALENPTGTRFFLAGLVFGCAAIFKHTGAPVICTAFLCWLITRREHRKHLLLLTAFGLVVAAYVAGMIVLFDIGHHQWYLEQTIIQLERVTGLRASRGTLTSPMQFLYLASHQYDVFVPSLLVAVASFVTIVTRVIQCVRARSWRPLGRNILLFSWAVSQMIVFGISSLRFQQYFALILIPMYCYVWTEAAMFFRARGRGMAVVAGLTMAVAIAGGLGSFALRVALRHDNVLQQVKHYAATSIPRQSIVVTEEEIGDEIKQNWCAVTIVGKCRFKATYAITYKTYLQANPPSDPALASMMEGAVPVKTFTGFKEIVTVWKLR